MTVWEFFDKHVSFVAWLCVLGAATWLLPIGMAFWAHRVPSDKSSKPKKKIGF